MPTKPNYDNKSKEDHGDVETKMKYRELIRNLHVQDKPCIPDILSFVEDLKEILHPGNLVHVYAFSQFSFRKEYCKALKMAHRIQRLNDFQQRHYNQIIESNDKKIQQILSSLLVETRNMDIDEIIVRKMGVKDMDPRDAKRWMQK